MRQFEQRPLQWRVLQHITDRGGNTTRASNSETQFEQRPLQWLSVAVLPHITDRGGNTTSASNSETQFEQRPLQWLSAAVPPHITDRGGNTTSASNSETQFEQRPLQWLSVTSQTGEVTQLELVTVRHSLNRDLYSDWVLPHITYRVREKILFVLQVSVDQSTV